MNRGPLDPVDLFVAIVLGVCYGAVLIAAAISSGRKRVNRAIAQARHDKFLADLEKDGK